MKRIDPRKTLSVAALTDGPIVVTRALAQSQGDCSMGSGMTSGYGADWIGGGGYGGILLLVLLAAVVAGPVAWIVAQKRKQIDSVSMTAGLPQRCGPNLLPWPYRNT